MIKTLVIDNGEYTGFAERLARETDVAYFSQWTNSYPLSRQVAPGLGVPRVQRVNDPIQHIFHERPDLIIVPDLYQNDYENLARTVDIPVFGSNDANRLETDRWFLKEWLNENNLPVGMSIVIDGTDDLKDFLQEPDNEDKWIKVSTFRGDMQTYHHRHWWSSEPWLTELCRRLGPLGKNIQFIIEDPIEDAVEVSIEGIWLDDAPLLPLMVGYEIKDAGEFGLFCHSVDELPEQVQQILSTLGLYYQKHKYRNWFALELRVRPDGETFLTDATCRLPVPPGYAMMSAIHNLTEAVYAVACGKRIDLDVRDTKYLSEIKLKSPWIVEDFLEVRFPNRYTDNIYFEHHCQIDGYTWIIPHVPSDPEMDSFGSACGCGPTKSSAASECRKVAESVEADQLVYNSNVLEQAEIEIERGANLGFPE